MDLRSSSVKVFLEYPKKDTFSGQSFLHVAELSLVPLHAVNLCLSIPRLSLGDEICRLWWRWCSWCRDFCEELVAGGGADGGGGRRWWWVSPVILFLSLHWFSKWGRGELEFQRVCFFLAAAGMGPSATSAAGKKSGKRVADTSIIAATGTTPASFSTFSVSLSLRYNSSSSSSISASLDHKPSLQMPFLLGKRLRSDDHDYDAFNKHTVSAIATAGGGFKAIPMWPNFGQVWSFAAAASSDMVVLQHSKLRFLRDFFSSSPWGRARGVGDSAARVGNYPR